jgi:Major Facilitator Superfamily
MSGATAGRAPAAMVLAVGIVALEFAAAVSRFVASTLLPVIAGDLHARDQLALLVAGSSLGLFVALPVAGRVVGALGSTGSLSVGVVAYVGGLVIAATARQAWVFMLGQFAGGVASGLLAVFAVSAAIQNLDEALRVRVVAMSSAMWIAPALIGPAATLGLEHLIGWRWTLLVPLPVVMAGRFLVVRAVREQAPATGPQRPLARTLLVPVGAAGVIFGAAWWPIAAAGAVVALVGVTAIMPDGMSRLTRGTPAALAAMTLFAVGYFGADSLITVLLTEGYHASLGQAAIVLGAAPLAWGVTSLVMSRLVKNQATARFPVVGLALSTLGVLSVALGTLTAPVFALALTGWSIAGLGVGLAYPALYILSTTTGVSTLEAAALATAVITAEDFGGLLGKAGGGAVSSLSGTTGLSAAYLIFAAALAAAAFAATRARAVTGITANGRRELLTRGDNTH